jgi:hypothetical protein
MRREDRLQAELDRTLQELTAACGLERAALERHRRERTPESEAAYLGRRREADRLRELHRRLLEELARVEGR